MERKPHVAIVPSPGMGHVIPLVEFAKQLVLHHDFTVTFLVTTIGPPPKAQIAALEALPEGINYTFLPPVTFEDLKTDVRAETQISLTFTRSLSSIRLAFDSLVANTRLVALVVDLFGTDVFEVAKEFHVPPYVYFTSSAMFLSLMLHLPKLDGMVCCEYKELHEPVKLPGCRPVYVRDLPDPVQDRKNDAYKWFVHHGKRYSLAEGIMVNSFVGLQADTIKALQEQENGKLSIYPVGPLTRKTSRAGTNDASDECLKWLNDQPIGSVLFVSFGSGGTLSFDQLNELALGLEMSEQKFLWVVKAPNDTSASATYFNHQNTTDPFGFLPDGFLDRTKRQGLVVSSWAPQVEILGHGSTGGFLTHCGWNSTLEGIVHGVPLIVWPLFAEQKMNAVLLSEELKVALRPNPNMNGLVEREEIAKVVKGLMQGEEGVRICILMNIVKDAAAKAISKGGSSSKTLSDLMLKWKNCKGK